MIIPILLAICAFAFGILLYFMFKRFLRDHELSLSEIFRLIIVGAILFFLAWSAISCFSTVAVGHAKLVIDPVFNTISDPYLGAVYFFRNHPWTYTVDVYYAMTSTEMWTDEQGLHGEYPALHVLSKDGLDIEVDILIRYSLEPTALKALYQSFPDLRYEDRAISSVVREDVRDVVSQYTALEIIEERESMSLRMTEYIYDSLITEPSLHQALTNIEIDLRDIDPPQKFKEAIEAKLTAEQQKIQAEFEKERTLILANATAQKAIIEAQGMATAKIIQAEATKEALYMIFSVAPEANATEVLNLYLFLQEMKNLNIPIIIAQGGQPLFTIPAMPPAESPAG